MDICLLCFLEDKFHHLMRRNSQASTRHLENLESYRRQLIESSQKIKPINDCEIHSHLTHLVEYVSKLQSCIDIAAESWETIEQIIKVYQDWNNGQTFGAIQKLRHFVEFNQPDFDAEIRFPYILYRGRSSDSKLTKDEILHVPFDERYKSGPQRFSIPGQPIIYLASSIALVHKELRITADKEKTLQISAYLPKDVNVKKIYDLTNSYHDLDWIYDALTDGCRIVLETDELNGDKARIRRGFRKFILMQCCCFPKKHPSSVFCEEYVIPQMLTEVLRDLGYDGIKFPSTVLEPGRFSPFNFYNDNRHRENYAIFTRYNEIEKYDQSLKTQFWTSTPIEYRQNSISIRGSMNEIAIEFNGKLTDHGVDGFSVLKTSLSHMYEDVIKLDGEDYWQTDFGIFQRYLAKAAFDEFINENKSR